MDLAGEESRWPGGHREYVECRHAIDRARQIAAHLRCLGARLLCRLAKPQAGLRCRVLESRPLGFCGAELRRLIVFAIASGASVDAPFNCFLRDMPAVARGFKPHHDARLLRCPSAFSTLFPFGQREEEKMKNPLDSLWGTVIAGFVLTVILYYIVKSVIGG